MDYLDELSSEAKLIGAVNTVENRDGRLIGYNTDAIWDSLNLLMDTKTKIKGKKVTDPRCGRCREGVAVGLCYRKCRCHYNSQQDSR